ncbi:unnamed protein product, partial [Amoebophrya sp. A25]
MKDVKLLGLPALSVLLLLITLSGPFLLWRCALAINSLLPTEDETVCLTREAYLSLLFSPDVDQQSESESTSAQSTTKLLPSSALLQQQELHQQALVEDGQHQVQTVGEMLQRQKAVDSILYEDTSNPPLLQLLTSTATSESEWDWNPGSVVVENRDGSLEQGGVSRSEKGIEDDEKDEEKETPDEGNLDEEEEKKPKVEEEEPTAKVV